MVADGAFGPVLLSVVSFSAAAAATSLSSLLENISFHVMHVVHDKAVLCTVT
jgi:hypothetical protein